jgi:hypothetical protein
MNRRPTGCKCELRSDPESPSANLKKSKKARVLIRRVQFYPELDKAKPSSPCGRIRRYALGELAASFSIPHCAICRDWKVRCCSGRNEGIGVDQKQMPPFAWRLEMVRTSSGELKAELTACKSCDSKDAAAKQGQRSRFRRRASRLLDANVVQEPVRRIVAEGEGELSLVQRSSKRTLAIQTPFRSS